MYDIIGRRWQGNLLNKLAWQQPYAEEAMLGQQAHNTYTRVACTYKTLQLKISDENNKNVKTLGTFTRSLSFFVCHSKICDPNS